MNISESHVTNEQPSVVSARKPAAVVASPPVEPAPVTNTNGDVHIERLSPHSIIVDGHATFLRAMNNRYRNLTQIKMICANNNLKVI
jgi:hypothetical protein